MTRRARPDGLQIEAPSPRRFLTTALIVPILLLVVMAWLQLEFQRSGELREHAAHSFNRRIEQIILLSHLKDAETAQRGFLLTGDPAFLKPYEPARAAVRQQIEDMLATPDPDVAPSYIVAIDRLTTAKFAELDRTIALQRGGDTTVARHLVANGDGQRVMDRLRLTIGAMIAEEDRQSRQREAVFIAYRGRVQTIVFGVVSGLVLMLFAFLLFVWRLRVQRHGLIVAVVEAGERHATILDSTIDAILILNPSGTVETMNAAASRMLGYQSAELERRDIAAIVDIAPGEGRFHQRIGLIDGQLRRSFVADRTIRHRDGREIPVDIAMGVMKLPSGDHVVVSLRDISERKRIERVKDDLMSTVSHELRTPLTSIVGSLGLLRAGVAGALPAEAGRLVEIAENNSRRLIRLINDMLDIDRIESGKLKMELAPIDLRTVIDQACVGSEGLARAFGVTLRCERRDRVAMVSGDAERLLQVVTNLMSNAIRVSPPGADVELGLTIAGGRATVYIDDAGPGVPSAFRDRIFGRFERADPHDAASGTGLGLAISREIVTHHDGTLWFEDRAGGGTRFAFTLALLSGAVERDAYAPTVLICEDDRALADDLAALVRVEGCAYDVVDSAAAAREAMARRCYIALIVGIALPEAGGLAFAQSMRDELPPRDVPIFVVATVPGAGDGPSALDVIDWIEKPGDPGRLSLALRTALARTNVRMPVILHLDDDPDLLEVVAASIEPEARIVAANDVPSARAILQRVSPDVAILDMKLAVGSGIDLIPFLVDADGLAIPTIIYSAQDVSAELAGRVDAVLVKARGSIPDLKATIRRVVRPRVDAA